MELKKILALAMVALLALPSLTMVVRADPGEDDDLADAITRARLYLDKVRTSAENLASLDEYKDDPMIQGYLNEINELLDSDGEEAPEIIDGPEILLQKGEFGTAKMRYDEAHGNYVFLSDGGVGLLDDNYVRRDAFGMGRVVIKGVDTLLSAIDTLSYDFYYTFPDTIIHLDFQAFPYMVLECDRTGGDNADLWIVLISTQIEHDAHSGESMPALKTWLTWTLDDYDNWHDAAGTGVGSPTDGASLDAMKSGYPVAKVLNVKVAVGEWAMGDYDAITGCVDDIEIDGVTYDLEDDEEEPEYLGAEGFLDQASSYLDDGEFNLAARSLAAARNILGRVKGLLNSMIKVHKVTRIERFEQKFERRMERLEDKIERLRERNQAGNRGQGKGPKKEK